MDDNPLDVQSKLVRPEVQPSEDMAEEVVKVYFESSEWMDLMCLDRLLLFGNNRWQ